MNVSKLMRGYAEQRRTTSGYTEFLRRKVEAARTDIRAGRFFTNEEVEAKFAARRAETLRRLQASDNCHSARSEA